MTESRSRNGCWTCRLRRRKCDERGPHCRECESRNLTCHGFGEKPSWMDGGPRERAQLATVKHAVANGVQQRRMRLQANRSSFQIPTDLAIPPTTSIDWSSSTSVAESHFDLQTPASSLTSLTDDYEDAGLEEWSPEPPMTFNPENPCASWNPSGNIPLVNNFLSAPNLDLSIGRPTEFGAGFILPDLSTLGSSISDAIPTPQTVASSHTFNALAPFNPETGIGKVPRSPLSPVLLPGLNLQDTCLLVHYLEEVFPWQFPFLASQGSALEKGCVLRLISQSYPLTLAVLALTAYFMRISCKEPKMATDAAPDQLARQYQGALQEFRRALHAHQQTRSGGADNDWVIATIVMLTCACAIQRDANCDRNWRVHIRAAIHMLPSHIPREPHGPIEPSKPSPPAYDTFLCQGSAPGPQSENERRASNFLTESIVWLEILSNLTGDEESPLLNELTTLLEDASSPIRLSHLMGCDNSVLACILRIQSLSRWKETAIANKSLSIWELTQTASTIGQKLGSSGTDSHRTYLLPQADSPKQRDSLSETITAIFSYAATIFLEVVVSGDYPRLPKIRDAVADAMSRLELIRDPGLLRDLAWPLCVVGSMAEPESYGFFETLLERSSGVDGVLANVLRLLREAWRRGGEGRGGTGSGVPWVEARRNLETER